MNLKSNHLLLEAYKCNKNLNKNKKIKKFLYKLCNDHNFTILNFSEKEFDNGGYTAVFLLGESHLSIHTWVEYSYFSFDIFHCSDFKYKKVIKKIEKFFDCDVKYKYINRLDFK